MGGEWVEVPIGEIAEIFDGPHATPAKTESGPIFLGISNLDRGRLNLAQTEHLSDGDWKRWTRRVTPSPGDVVFSYETRIGEAALVPENLKCCLGRRMGLLRARPGKVEPRFLLYAYLGPHFQGVLRSRTVHGSTVDRIPLIEMPAFPILVPKRHEIQRAIAGVLGSLDDKIELSRRMNRTLEEMARAIFKSWFIDFGPVRAKAAVRRQHPKWADEQVSRAACPKLKPEIACLFPDSFEDSELGEIPKGWRVGSLDEIARFLNGLALQRFPPEDGDSLPVIKIAQLRAGNTAGADRASARLNPDYIVRDGDILFSWSGSLECVLWAGGPGALNQHLFKVTSSEYPKWLCYFAVHQHLDEFRHIAASKATTMGHIQRHHLAAAKIVIPADANLLSAMDEVLDPMIESLWQREVMSRTLAALRDALLPKLISGELRVRDAERIVQRKV